jgi:hypothetical protein
MRRAYLFASGAPDLTLGKVAPEGIVRIATLPAVHYRVALFVRVPGSPDESDRSTG